MGHIGKLAMIIIAAANLFFIVLLLMAAYSPYVNAVEHPLRASMGLTFPIFLFINFCFFVFFLLIKYKFAVLPLAGFLLCTPQIRTYFPINSRTKHVPEESIKILSYNIMLFDHFKKIDGKNPILTYIQESNADIICLQEFVPNGNKNRLTHTEVDAALKAYPYKSFNRIGKKHKDGTNGMVCYSKFPILSSKPVAYESDHNGSVVHEIKIGNDTITLINNHLESNKLSTEDKVLYEGMIADPEARKVKRGMIHLLSKLQEAVAIRAIQAKAVAAEIAASKHPYIIVCGDFNDSPLSNAHRIISADLDDAFTKSGRGPGISYNRNKFYFRIDHILISKNLKAYNCTVDRSIKDSDHYPIWCYISKK